MQKLLLSSIFFSLIISQSFLFGQNKEKKGLKKLLGVHVEEVNDKFEGTTTYRMKGNKVKIEGAVGSSIIKGAFTLLSKNRDLQLSIMTTRLQLEKHIKSDGSEELAIILKVTIDDDARFWVMSGESLIFLVDGKRMALSTDGDFNSDAGFDSNMSFDSKTNARYPVTKSDLEKIISAEEVEFRIMQESIYEGQTEVRDKEKGSHFEGFFSKKNFKAWKDFYEDYIVNKPSKS